MLNMMRDHVAFNGRPSQYVEDPIRVKVGDRVRSGSSAPVAPGGGMVYELTRSA